MAPRKQESKASDANSDAQDDKLVDVVLAVEAAHTDYVVYLNKSRVTFVDGKAKVTATEAEELRSAKIVKK